MEMSKIEDCAVADCAYNRDNMCHAIGITVGDGEDPACDTFLGMSGEEAAMCVRDAEAGVGACKMVDCRFNGCLQCGAEAVNVMAGTAGPRCGTFAQV